jgi:hypothetical protein
MSDPINSAAFAEGTAGEKNPYLATIEAARKGKAPESKKQEGTEAGLKEDLVGVGKSLKKPFGN